MSRWRAGQWGRANWFVLLAPALFLAAWMIGRSTPWATEPRAMEAALLFDACVTVPALYALCYGRSFPLWQLAVRMLGLACLGIYLLGYVVPPDSQVMLPAFAWVRTVGLGVLVLIEVRIMVAAVRLLFGPGTTAEEVAAQTGAPPLVARLMLLEARMWRSVARFLRRR